MTKRFPRPAGRTARELMREWEVVLPGGMHARAAAGLLYAVGVDVAPVVGSSGRCVGVFSARDYRRALNRARAGGAGGPILFPARPAAEVRDHMTRRFAAAGLEAGADELLHRLARAAAPYLVVLDRQRRPRGVVCGLDVLAAGATRARTRPAVARAD
jgi:CBS-domain-containing membrane protein